MNRLSLSRSILITILITISFASYWEGHVYAGKVANDVVIGLEIENPVVRTITRYSAIATSHLVADRLIGEHGTGEYSYDSTIIGVSTMFFATSAKDRLEFLEIVFFGCIVPDVMFKDFFHPEYIRDPILQLTKDQTVLIDKFAVMIYCVRIEF